MNEETNKETTSAKRERVLQGWVVSDRMDKTVTVLVERQVKHALYGKYIRRSSKLQAHDENNECLEGDFVRIAACRPLSKNKAWQVARVLERPARVADLNEETVNAGMEVEE